MSVSLTRKGIAVAVAAGLVTVGAATTVSYAAGSAKTVTACANKKGQLGLLSKKNKCAKGFAKVAIAKQGPRGATGPRGLRGLTGKAGATGKTGVAGQQGPAGPGTVYASEFYLGNDPTGDTTTVDGIDYTTSCGVSGTGNLRVVNARVTLSAADGKYVTLDGVRVAGSDDNPSTTAVHLSDPSITSTLSTSNSQPSTARFPSAMVIHEGKAQLMTLRVNSFPNDTQLGFAVRCSFDLVVTRAG